MPLLRSHKSGLVVPLQTQLTALRSSSTTRACPFAAATCSGVSPSALAALTGLIVLSFVRPWCVLPSRRSSTTCTTERLPFFAATCNAVLRLRSVRCKTAFGCCLSALAAASSSPALAADKRLRAYKLGVQAKVADIGFTGQTRARYQHQAVRTMHAREERGLLRSGGVSVVVSYCP